MKPRSIDYATGRCSLARLLVAASERGVCHVRLGTTDAELERGLRAEFPFAVLARDEIRLKPWRDALIAYADGHATRLDLPLDVSGSSFQRRVWEALRAIPRGSTRSYSEVAQSIGSPGAARAVARACATNPVAIAIPCHRVIGADGSLGGYHWGPERKRALLAREGAHSDHPGGPSQRLGRVSASKWSQGNSGSRIGA